MKMMNINEAYEHYLHTYSEEIPINLTFEEFKRAYQHERDLQGEYWYFDEYDLKLIADRILILRGQNPY